MTGNINLWGANRIGQRELKKTFVIHIIVPDPRMAVKIADKR